VKRLAIVAALLVAACSVEVMTSTPAISPAASPASSLPSPEHSVAPPPDVPADPAFGLPYGCGAAPFDVRIFSMPPSAETSNDAAVDGLRKTLVADPSLPHGGWWLIGRSERDAEFAARDARGALWYVRVEVRDGAWNIHSWGGCGLRLQIEGLSTVVWHLDPAVPFPGPETRVIRAVVSESCVPDPLVGRLQAPIIRSTADLVLVAFTARPGIGGDASLPKRVASVQRMSTADSSDSIASRPLYDHCPGGSSATVEVDLGEPLGDRRLVDGATWPGRDARQPLEP
jgi:hypothetical protein